jgi:Mg-chelatase subunit ChlD
MTVLIDETITKVSIPNTVNQSSPEIIANVVESACYSRLAEEFMVSKFATNKNKYQLAKNINEHFSSYFGGHDGHFRQVPALHQVQCGCYDPRRRPWFVAASSGPKNVVIVIDVSESMDQPGRGRISIAREAAVTIVDTLTAADSFAVIAFNSSGYQLGGTNLLLEANIKNKEHLKTAINQLEADGTTNFYEAFKTAFDTIDYSLGNEELLDGPIAILFMTDGKIGENMKTDDREKETRKVIDLVNERTRQLSEKNKNVTIFTYSLGGASDQNVTKTIACSTGGIWTPVEDCGNLVGQMSSYYKLFALGNQNAVTWVDAYKFNFRGVMGTTVSVPVYDRSVTPPIFLGGELNAVWVVFFWEISSHGCPIFKSCRR